MTGGGRAARGALAAVCLGVFLGALDQTVVATLLPAIIDDLEVPFTRLSDVAWVVNGYLLGYTVAMPLVGRLADVVGRARVFVGCLALFVGASVLCGLATSLEMLIAARALQAVGGGAMLPVALAIAAEDADAALATRLGLVAAVAEAGGVLGPLYGAGFVEWSSWRWAFFVNAPLGLAIGLLVWRACPDRRGGGRVDAAGAATLGLALGALTVGLSQEGALFEPSAAAVALLGAGAVLVGVFALVERRAREPIFPPALFRLGPFAAAIAVNGAVGAALIVTMVDVPLWSATVLQRGATEGGLLLLRLTLPIPAGALLGGWLTRRAGPRVAATAGLALAAYVFWRMAGWAHDVGDDRMKLDLALGGAAFGLLLAPVTAVAIAWAGPERAGVAAALVTIARMVGMMLGLAALTSHGLGRFRALVAALPLPLPVAGESTSALAARQAAYAEQVRAATVQVFHEVFAAAAIICLAAVLAALALRLPRPASDR